ncbi:MAG TPA: histidine kinase [Gemmatimonadaceae bacterium]
MAVSHLELRGDSPPAFGDDSDTTARDTLVRRYRPVAISVLVFMSMSFLAWWQDSPAGQAPLSFATWLLLCMAGAVTSVTAFAFALRLSDQRPLIWVRSWKDGGVHAGAAAACVAIDFISRAIVIPRSPIPVRPLTTFELTLDAVGTYLLMVLACQGFRAVRDARKAEKARVRLRAELFDARQRRAEAELRALKAELSPHFLGNALQGVKALMRTDVDAAHRLLSPLADMLRTALTRASTQETTLREEIEALRPFVDVERARLRGRLELQLEVDAQTLDLLVPDMILQPLVENAVKHGLMPFAGGRIRLAARLTDATKLELCLEDDGVALGSVGTTRSSARGGVGVANIRARLGELYGDQAMLELTRGGLGTLVRVTLPARHADTADPVVADVREPDGPAADDNRATAIPPFAEQTWAERGERVFAMAATICLWFYCAQSYVVTNVNRAAARGYDDKQLYSIVDGVVVAMLTVVMVFAALWLGRRLPIAGHSTQRVRPALRALGVSLAMGAALSAVVCVVKAALALVFHYWVVLAPSHLRANVFRTMIFGELQFIVMCALAQAYHAIRRSEAARSVRRRLSLQLEDTRRRRGDAELRALKSELNPHFICNALTAVSVLMRTDSDAAARVLDQLSDLLRAAVDDAATQEVTLREELESLQPYLAVERVRLGRELDVGIDVDQQSLEGRVPHMILQPLVENAVRHGFAPQRGVSGEARAVAGVDGGGDLGGHIRVHAHRDARYLELTVCDDGAGISSASATNRAGGTGLANARARLSKLYGQSASLELSQAPHGGAIARLVIPWHESGELVPQARPSRPGSAASIGHVPTVNRRPASAAGGAGNP